MMNDITDGRIQPENIEMQISLDTSESDSDSPEFQLVALTLTKTHGEGLGFSIVEVADNCGVSVSIVIPETAAEKCGLQPGDLLCEINGEDVRNWDRKEVALLLRCVPNGEVFLTVTRKMESAENQLILSDLSNVDSLGEDSRYDVQAAEKLAAKSSKTSKAPSGREIILGPTKLSSQISEVFTGDFWRSGGSNRDTGLLDNEPRKSRLSGLIYSSIFGAEVIAGFVLIILECVTAGLFTSKIYGQEYVGIYVGVFELLCGIAGFYFSRLMLTKHKEKMVFLLNCVLTIANLVNSSALLIASSVLLSEHVRNPVLVTSATDYDFVHLIGLKSAVIAFYAFSIVLCALFFGFVFYDAKKKASKN